MLAQIAQYVINCGFRSFKDPVNALALMPSMAGRDEKPGKSKVVRRKRSLIAMEARATMAHFLRGH